MLEPHGRTLLFDILKPPEDHRLDTAIATTFTLDLLALLTAPVAFSLFDVDDHRELLDQNSLTLLESLRRYADKLTVFCQVGHISLPKVQFPQLEFLENSIIQCRAPKDGAFFHPKIWLLRFVAPEDRVTYRFVCLTRNLTFDRCWDTVLTLEGPVRGAVRAVNRPLADFVGALPGMATSPVDDKVRTRAESMGDEVRRVDFVPPDGFESYEFHTFGMSPVSPFPFDHRPGPMLVISPFISDAGVERLVRGRQRCLLVSRPESLEDPGCQEHGAFEKLYVLARETEQETDEATEQATSDLTRGLHAKCYVIDDGAKAHIFTGSANATAGAFGSNVEFMVELVGPRARFGINALFRREDGRTCLGDLLEEFKPEPKARDTEEEGRTAAIETTRSLLANRQFTSLVSEAGDDFSLQLTWIGTFTWPDKSIRVQCWPVSVGRGKALSIGPDHSLVKFERLSFEALTAFIAFEIAIEGSQRPEVFVLNVPLRGAPSDRRERLLRSFIKDRQRLIRFLMFLLADDSELADAFGAKVGRNGQLVGPGEAAQSNGALLETLLRSLHQAPQRLDAVAKLVADVKTQSDASQLLPPGFDQIWAPIWAARQGRQP